MLYGGIIPKKTYETNEQAYNVSFNHFLEHLRSNHKCPKKGELEKDLHIHLSTYEITFKELKIEALKQRIDEIFNENEDMTFSELQSLLGIGIYRSDYLKKMGFSYFSELRFSYTRKKTRRKYATWSEALTAFRSKVKELILNGKYTCEDDVIAILGTNPNTYNIKWKTHVLYPVYEEIINGELRENPRITENQLKAKYSFAQSLLDKERGLIRYKRKKGIIFRSHTNREQLLDNCVKVFNELAKQKKGITRKKIQRMVGAHLKSWNINMSDIYERAQHKEVSQINKKILDMMHTHDNISCGKITEYLFEECPELLKDFTSPQYLIESLLDKMNKVNLLTHQKGEGYSLGYFARIIDFLRKNVISIQLYKEPELLDLIQNSIQEVKIPEDLLTTGWQMHFFEALKSMGIMKEIKLGKERYYNLNNG